jgi:hypothetical protein
MLRSDVNVLTDALDDADKYEKALTITGRTLNNDLGLENIIM